MIGIYSIKSPTGKYYFGQSWNIEKRFQTYRRLNCKGQPHLFHSLIKHGVDAHEFSILKALPEIKTQAELDYWERHMIISFRQLGASVMNGTYGGRSSSFSDPETRRKISRSKLGVARKDMQGDKNFRARAIIQYDLKMNQIAEFTTVTMASEHIGISRQGISDCINGRNKTAAGFIWKYKNEL